MLNVVNKWTTNDILDKVSCHRATALRMAETLGIVPERAGNMCLFSQEEAEDIIKEIKHRQRKRSK